MSKSISQLMAQLTPEDFIVYDEHLVCEIPSGEFKIWWMTTNISFEWCAIIESFNNFKISNKSRWLKEFGAPIDVG